MKPQLAKTYGPRYDKYPCFVQPKLNGIRALYQNGSWQSRDEIIWHPSVLKHISDELATLHPAIDNVILDGELYVHGWKLQRINSAVAVNRKNPTLDTPFVSYHIFDIVNPNATFSERWLDVYNQLQSLDLPHVRTVPTAFCSSAPELQLHFTTYVSAGYEGIMLRPDGPYIPTIGSRRSDFLYKHKSWKDAEYTCVGVTKGEGKADIGIGALVLRTANGVNFHCGTGFSDEDRIFLAANPPIGKLVKIRYNDLTADLIPYPCSFLMVMS